MAHTAQTWQELIPDVFCPHVAVMCTRDAEAACQKNNLTFVEMMRPFCQLTTEAHVRDAHNQPHVVKNLRLRFSEPTSEVPSMGATKQTIHNTVLKSQLGGAIVPGSTLQVGNLTLNVLTPWFEAYRQQYIQLLRVSDHEYLRHYVGCLFVVSTSHARPMDAFVELQKKQQDMAKEKAYPKWLTPYVFYFFLLIHDVSRGEEDNAQSIFQSMKAAFGQHSSHMLKINSRSPDSSLPSGMPDPWGQYLNQPDSQPLEDDLDDSDPKAMSSLSPKHPGAAADATMSSQAEASKAPTLSDLAVSSADENVRPDVPMSDPLSQAISDPLSAQGPQEDTAGSSVQENTFQTASARPSISVSGGGGDELLHGHYLTVSDHDRLRIFVNELAVRGLVPHIERSIRTLAEQVNSKKGIQRTLYSATRKWFGGANKPVIMQGQSYTSDAAELQSRKLADLAFLVQLYDTAFNWYHTAKRDFQNDNAMLHYSGALELAAVSLFMQGAYRRDPQSYFEEAVNNYENACKSHQFALRSTLLFFEFLKFRGLYKEAASALIRMTTDESDLAAALLTEQAAICYLRLPAPMIRKYAMHMLLAGHRFKKAYQRQHALRTYTLALQVYQTKGWWVAEDHMNYIIGRLAMDLHDLGLAQESFHHLLSHKLRLAAPNQQALYLQEFLLAMKKFLAKQDKAAMEKSQMSMSSCVDIANFLPLAHFPSIDAQHTRVILPGVADSTTLMSSDSEVMHPEHGATVTVGGPRHPAGDNEGNREELWLCMEELAARFTVAVSDTSARNGYLGATPPGFVWDVRLFGPHTDNSQHPRCALGERVKVEIVLNNDLQIPLTLSSISLMWQLFAVPLVDGSTAEIATAAGQADGEGDEPVICESISSVTLAAHSSQAVCLSLSPQQEGKLHILGVVYTITETSPAKEGGRTRSGTQRESLASGLRFRQEIEPRGPRLNLTKEQKCSVMYGPDRRLQLSVYPPMPLLKMEFEGMPSVLLCGEVRHCKVKLTNVGRVALRRLRAVCPENQQIVWGDINKQLPPRDGIYSTVGQATPANGSTTSSSLSPSHYPSSSSSSCQLRDKVWPCFPLSASSAYTGSSPLVVQDRRARVCDIDLPSDCMEPGSTAEIDVWIRGSHLPGDQTIDTLMYFDVAGEKAFTHRVLRHTSHIQVTESIRIAARARRSVAVAMSSRDQNQLLVSVDVENLSQGDAIESPKFTVKQIVGVSSKFGLESLHGNEPVELSSRETSYIHLKAEHRKVDDGHVHISNMSYTQADKVVDSLTIPCLELFGQDTVAQPFAASEPDRNVQAQSSPFSMSSRPSSSMQGNRSSTAAATTVSKPAACVAATIGVIVLWEAQVPDEDGESRVAYGQYHLVIESLETPVSSVTAQSSMVPSFSASVRAGMEGGASDGRAPSPEALLLKPGLRHVERLQHNFDRKKLCIVPVELVLHNCQDSDIEVEVMSNTAAGLDSDQAALLNMKSVGSTAFSWVGCMHFKCRIKPGCQNTVRVSACFSKPAVYNLSSLRFRARKADGGPADGTQWLDQRRLTPSLFTLEDKQ